MVEAAFGRGNNGRAGGGFCGRRGGERTVQKVKERKVKRRRRRDMTGRYEALKGALVAPLTTLLGGREEGGGGRGQGEESAFRSLVRWPPRAPLPPLHPFS